MTYDEYQNIIRQYKEKQAESEKLKKYLETLPAPTYEQLLAFAKLIATSTEESI